MTRKNDLKDDARHHYFEQEQPKGSNLLAYSNGYEKGFQMALHEVKLILDMYSNNLDRLNAIRELVNEMCNEVKDEVSMPDELNVVTVDDPGGEVYPAENAESALVSFFFNPNVKP